MVLTLSTTKKKVYLNENNISFAVSTELQNEDTKIKEQFTRIYLKEIKEIEDFVPWVDVDETIEEIENFVYKNKGE